MENDQLLSCGHPIQCSSEMLPDFIGDTPATQRIGTVHCQWCAELAGVTWERDAAMHAFQWLSDGYDVPSWDEVLDPESVWNAEERFWDEVINDWNWRKRRGPG
jgi:hypothetical protein